MEFHCDLGKMHSIVRNACDSTTVQVRLTDLIALYEYVDKNKAYTDDLYNQTVSKDRQIANLKGQITKLKNKKSKETVGFKP